MPKRPPSTKLPPDEVRKAVTVMLSDYECALADAEADASGLTRGSWIRAKLFTGDKAKPTRKPSFERHTLAKMEAAHLRLAHAIQSIATKGSTPDYLKALQECRDAMIGVTKEFIKARKGR